MPQRRLDAVQNRAKLLEAGEAVFLELGINAPLDAIAERAGVGRATLFRNFVDRRSLIMALLDRGLDEIEGEARAWRVMWSPWLACYAS
ncbi:helix-turn-helix domain-containing protein [Sphingomonas sp. Ant20]|uniref:TetR/AcrR family transcriptional regulator n=1 Tax=Sphingomonas sp. Ant20 TaxID=104605 RepID=UPI000691952B|nr:helix-turn-helix domain-containing protein [Sphingomonas sp. Ant20]